MSCIVNNPTCMNGWEHNPVTNKFRGRCTCAFIKNARRRYHQANGDIKLMTFPDQLSGHLHVYNYHNKESILSRDLMQQILEHIDALIEHQTTIYLTGVPGCGKSQFASSLLYQAAYEGKHSYFLEADTFHDVIFDYKNPEHKVAILEKVISPNTKILILDNMAAELANKTEKQVDVVTKEYKRLLRAFNGLRIVTSLYLPDDFKALCNHDPSLISLLLPQNNMKTYVFEDIDFRKQHAPKELEALF